MMSTHNDRELDVQEQEMALWGDTVGGGVDGTSTNGNGGTKGSEKWSRKDVKQEKPKKVLKPLRPLLKREMHDPALIFWHLCGTTVAHGDEGAIYGKLLKALGFKPDAMDNYYLEILEADGTPSRTAFMAHMDTASHDTEPVVLRWKGDWVFTDEGTVLGADDRAGMTVLIHMALSGVPGLYCLFVGEEQGCVGSKAAAKQWDRFQSIDRAISFDRKGKGSVITKQGGQECCSPAFARSLCARLSAWKGATFTEDPGGSYTDSKQFVGIVPECTNISVGYEAAHTRGERQDYTFLRLLCWIVCQVDWKTLPTVRDPKATPVYPRTYGAAYGSTHYEVPGYVENEVAAFRKWCVEEGIHFDMTRHVDRWGSRQPVVEDWFLTTEENRLFRVVMRKLLNKPGSKLDYEDLWKGDGDVVRCRLETLLEVMDAMEEWLTLTTEQAAGETGSAEKKEPA